MTKEKKEVNNIKRLPRNIHSLIAVIISVAMLFSMTGFAMIFTQNVSAAEASISTNKTKYVVGEQMVISGIGFTPDGTVDMSVLRPDKAVEAWAVTADATGAFSTLYTPTPSIPGRFKFTATDGTNIATTAATEADAVGVDFKQAANNDKPYALGNVHWINSILQQNNSIYYEGMSVMQRLVFYKIPATTGNTHTLDFTHEAEKSGNSHAYDFLTSWDQAVAVANALSPGGHLLDSINATGQEIEHSLDVTGLVPELFTSTYYADVDIPDYMGTLPSVIGDVNIEIAKYEHLYGNRTIRIYALAPISDASLTFKGYDAGYATYTLNWTSTSTSVYVAMAGHLAIGGDVAQLSNVTDPMGYGPGLGASSISGGPYHLKLDNIDGITLGSQDNQIKGADILVQPKPELTITKTADSTISKVGDTLKYTFVITNTGNVTLNRKSVIDDVIGDITGDFPASLTAGQTATVYEDYTVKGSDPDPLVNTVTAIYTFIASDVTATDNYSVDLYHPGLNVTKEADNKITKVGDTVHFTITVENTGDVDLVLDTFTDTLKGDIKANFSGTLAVGAKESWGYDYTTLATDDDPLANTAVAHYHIAGLPNDITDNSKVEVDIVHPNTEVTITPDVFETLPGGNVILTITEKNTGDVALENVYVALDPGAIVLDKDTPNNPPASTFSGDAVVFGILDIGETWTWTYQVNISVDTEFTVNGFGKVVGLPNIISHDNGYLDERASITVKVTGATRTQGFWATHLTFTTYIFETYLGSDINLGWKDITNISELMGIFWANNAKTSTGAKRSALCQAKETASNQALAAILNSAMPGGAPLPAGYSLSQIAAILNGTNLKAVKDLNSALDAYNNLGDNIALDPGLPSTGRADPKGAKDIANIPFADCP